jgi:hypothetical protein
MRLATVALAMILALGLASAVEARPGKPHPRPKPTPTAQPSTTLTFALGSQTESAIRSTIPFGILSNWHAKPADTAWMTDAYHRSVYADAKARGYELHLITWTDLPETTGIGCGRQYPVTPGWLEDMAAVADAMKPTYVTLLTEFQTYACEDNRWSGQEVYWNALIANYEAAVPIFRAVGSKVSLGWGGWQTQTDRSLDRFLGVTEDFHSFQAMHGVSNVETSREMVRWLGQYGPVMQAHHKPDGDTNDPATVQRVFREDVAALFTDASVAALVADGLFAWAFLDDVGWPVETRELVRDTVARYGR